MINFINTGADEAILKSMPTDGCSEELIKTMNKQGLVQKDVTVQGKNGKTFTRKQWVKASDAKSDNPSKKSQQPVDKKTNSVKSDSSAKEWQKKLEDALYSAPGTAADYAVGQVLKELPKGTVIKTGQKAMTTSPPYEVEVTYTKGDYDGWQYISDEYDTVYFNSVSKSICKVKDNSKFKLTVSVPESQVKSKADKDHSKDSFSEFLDFTKTDSRADYLYSRVEEARGDENGMSEGKSEQDWAEALKDYCGYDLTGKSQLKKTDKPATKPSQPSKKTLDPAHFDSIKSDKAEAMKYLKDCGVTWVENSHAGINWMRAMAAYKATTGGQSTTKTSTQPNSQATTPTAQVAQNTQGKGGKLSKEDAKKKTQSFTSKVGKSEVERKAFMDKVKAQGITWKDKADDGSDVAPAVNWMRCCMAMNKHFADGGSFDDSSQSTSTKKSVHGPDSGKKYKVLDKRSPNGTTVREVFDRQKIGGISEITTYKHGQPYKNYTLTKDTKDSFTLTDVKSGKSVQKSLAQIVSLFSMTGKTATVMKMDLTMIGYRVPYLMSAADAEKWYESHEVK